MKSTDASIPLTRKTDLVWVLLTVLVLFVEILSWSEGSAWFQLGLLLVFPAVLWWFIEKKPKKSLRWLLGCTAGLLPVAIGSATLAIFDLESLSDRIQRWIPLRGGPSELEQKMTFGDCPRFRYKPIEGRDENGWIRYRHGTGEGFHGAIIGDSVSTMALGSALFMGMQRSNTSGLVTDTSLGGYNQVDEQCILKELLEQSPKPDFVLVGICLNDFGPWELELDLGQGRHRYSWATSVSEEMLQEGRLPLFLESNHPWVKKHRDTLIRHLGEQANFDFKEVEPFYTALSETKEFRENLDALGQSIELLKRHDVPAVFVIFPYNYRVQPNPLTPLINTVEKVLIDHEAKFLNLTSLLQSFPREDLLVSAFANHFKGDATINEDLSRHLDFVHFNAYVLRMVLILALDEAKRSYSQHPFEELRQSIAQFAVDAKIPRSFQKVIDPDLKLAPITAFLEPFPEALNLSILKGQRFNEAYRVENIEQSSTNGTVDLVSLDGKEKLSLSLFTHPRKKYLYVLQGTVRISINLEPEQQLSENAKQAVQELVQVLKKQLSSSKKVKP